MLEILAIIALCILTFPAMLPAILIAAVTPLTLWPTYAVILAVLIVAGALKR